MQNQAQSIGRIITMVVFVLACFSLILFMWVTFGGPVPFQPHGYRFKVPLEEASQLTKEADVRISGVAVGKVKNVELDDGKALTTIEMDEEYAPVPVDTRVVQRTKSLLSEAYLEITPGSPDSPELAEGKTLSAANLEETVELDELLSTFDPKTREAMRKWLDQSAVALNGRGWDLNTAFAYFAPFTENLDKVTEILNRDDEGLRLMVKNGGEVFASLSQSGRLGSLVENSNTVFAVTASNSSELVEAVRLLPKFLDESKATVKRVDRFATDTDPLIRKMMPVAERMRPVMEETKEIAPDLKQLMEGLGPLFEASKDGIPGINKTLDNARPLMAQLYPFLLTLNPALEWIVQYNRETTALFGNVAALGQATDLPQGAVAPVHYIRVLPSLNSESFAAYPTRLPSNRANAYSAPGSFDQLATGLPVFSSATCSTDPLPTVGSTTPEDLKQLMDRFVFDLGSAMAPSCVPQPNFNFQGQSLRYPHVRPESP